MTRRYYRPTTSVMVPIIDPLTQRQTGRHIPPEGAFLIDHPFYRRAVRAGDLTSEPIPAAPEPFSFPVETELDESEASE